VSTLGATALIEESISTEMSASRQVTSELPVTREQRKNRTVRITSAIPDFSELTSASTNSPASCNTAEFSGTGHPDRDPLHRDKELLVNPFSLYWLHIWWGAYRMYLRMCSVLQGHNELDALHNRDV